MKKILLGLAVFSVCAFAVNKIISYSEFKTAALDAAEGTENSDCELKIKENHGGLVLTMRNESKTVSFFVSKEASIRKTGKSVSDGSFSYDYKVPGQGTLTVTHMDDAYFHVTLESTRDGKTANCDIDF